MKYLIGLILALLACPATAAEYAVVVAVEPHYKKPSCYRCIVPEQRGYDVWLEYRHRIVADRTNMVVQVGDKWRIEKGRLIGKPIPRNEFDYREPFPSNASDN